MDLTFRSGDRAFNYRVAAMILHEDRILIMQDEGIPHDYLPGGRVHLMETAAQALQRELWEELALPLPPNRLTFMAESFFTLMDVRYHEMCLYFRMDAPAELLARGDAFTMAEGGEIHHFRWVRFEELQGLSFYPVFLRKRIFSLPDAPEFITLDSNCPPAR